MEFFKANRFVYFHGGPEAPRAETPDDGTQRAAEGLQKMADKPDNGLHKQGEIIESRKVEGMVDYQAVADTAIDKAKTEGEDLVAKAKSIMATSKLLSEAEKPDAGNMTEKDAEAVIRLNEKLQHDVWRQERDAIKDMFPGSTVHTANADSLVRDFVAYPAVSRDLGLDKVLDFKGVFPELDGRTIHRGEHLIVSNDKKSIRIVKAAPRATDMPMMAKSDIITDDVKDVAHLSTEGLQNAIDNGKGYKFIDGRVRFLSRAALVKTTLGDMYKEAKVLKVNGRLVAKGENGEFYRVSKGRNGEYKMSKRREKVYNGTRIDENVPAEQVAEIERSLNPNTTRVVEGDGL